MVGFFYADYRARVNQVIQDWFKIPFLWELKLSLSLVTQGLA